MPEDNSDAGSLEASGKCRLSGGAHAALDMGKSLDVLVEVDPKDAFLAKSRTLLPSVAVREIPSLLGRPLFLACLNSVQMREMVGWGCVMHIHENTSMRAHDAGGNL